MSQSDKTKIAILQTQMDDILKKVDKIDQKQDALSSKMDSFMEEMRDGYVKSGEFLFWRNTMIVSILVIIAVAIIAKVLNVNIQ